MRTQCLVNTESVSGSRFTPVPLHHAKHDDSSRTLESSPDKQNTSSSSYSASAALPKRQCFQSLVAWYTAVKNWVVGVLAWLFVLGRGADLNMAQLMTLPLTVSFSRKIQIGFTFLVPARPGSPRQRAVKRVLLLFLMIYCSFSYSSLTLLDGQLEEHPAHNEWFCAGVVSWLEQSANDLHMVQMIVLPPSSIKSRMILPFWYWLIQVVLERGR